MIDVVRGLIEQRLTQCQIADRIGWSATTLRRFLSKNGLKTNPPQSFQGGDSCPPLCKICSNTNIADFRVRSPTSIRRNICRKCQDQATAQKRIDLKLKAITYKGGICQDCGIDSPHSNIYDFHHIDGTAKVQSITKCIMSGWSWSRLIVELDKCVLLCANCHRIRHSGVSNHGQIANRYSRYTIVCYNKRKARIFEMLGGACKHCGLVSEHMIYDLHHLDPTTKEFGLDRMTKIKWEDAVIEIQKCILLCANCHRIEHSSVKQ